MEDRTVALAVAVASAAAAVMTLMVPNATDSQAQSDAAVHRGYAGAVAATAGIGATAAYLDRSWAPLGVGLAVVGVLIGAHQLVQRTGGA